ncbi:hypothetical protein GCM10010294_13940 [Streptomyces griseoloalbus]|nr:hypothetical protein GCM10010294_13940 [Streptomyces griseoloalbus]
MAQDTTRFRQGPQHMPYEDGVVAPFADRWRRRVTDEEHRVAPGELLPGKRHHGRGPVDPGHPVPLFGGEE